jgi:malate synthase
MNVPPSGSTATPHDQTANGASSAAHVELEGVRVLPSNVPGVDTVLTREALAFAVDLHRRFDPRRRELLALRVDRQVHLDAGERPDFLEETAEVRSGSWIVSPLPDDLLDRRVEITGPVERKMIINALNSGASVFMADFEDSNSPTWENVIQGQVNLADAVRRTIEFTQESTGKHYALDDTTATLMVRPRGWHLLEKHVLVDGEPISASIFDFALYFFHNAKELIERGSGPYFYLPKMESHLEARLWNDVFCAAQDTHGIPRGTIKATVLIETILAAFEMDEILFELREHSAGLNCGRWDYIFSFIKRFAKQPDFVLPDRALVGMTQHFLHSYSQLLIRTCHRRRVHAMGGMAAQIPIKGDDAANEAAMNKVRADKLREVTDGHDGTWVAHPALVPLAKGIFDSHMPGPNQLDIARTDVEVSARDLLWVPKGEITEAGLRQNVCVGVQYLEAWLVGNGCVPLYNLMEDAATAEISRTQIWQWIRHHAELDDGRVVTAELFRSVLFEELKSIREALGNDRFEGGRFAEAAGIFDALSTADECEEFLTLPAYERLISRTN